MTFISVLHKIIQKSNSWRKRVHQIYSGAEEKKNSGDSSDSELLFMALSSLTVCASSSLSMDSWFFSLTSGRTVTLKGTDTLQSFQSGGR